MNKAIVYVSTASEELDESDIKKILDYSKDWNNTHNVSGILLFSEGNFFQVIEGEGGTIESLFQNIKTDKRHKNLIKIFEKEINKEAYDGYESDFISEETRYASSKLDHYLDYIKVLDQPSQMVVKNMLKAFIA